jgi:two-component system, OmpR family, alkaline phosphatase synthesis response regulator PhoP
MGIWGDTTHEFVIEPEKEKLRNSDQAVDWDETDLNTPVSPDLYPPPYSGKSADFSGDQIIDFIVHLPVETSHLPAEVLTTLARRRLALIGFAKAEAHKILQAFKEAKISSTVLDWAEVLPQSESLRQHDLFLLNLPRENTDALWMKITDLTRIKKPIICIGYANLLLTHMHKIKNSVAEFLLAPVDEEEVLVRVYNVLSEVDRQQAAKGPVQDEHIKVVLADDDPTTMSLVSTILKKYDIECHVAQNGQEVIDLCVSLRPDAAIFDISLPYLDGFEVLTTLKNNGKTYDIPTILLTARKQETDIMRAFSLGVDDYITKPFNPMELIARLKRLLKLPS